MAMFSRPPTERDCIASTCFEWWVWECDGTVELGGKECFCSGGTQFGAHGLWYGLVATILA